MPSTVVLYDALSPGATASGVWSFVSGEASAPPAPSTYNGSIDFGSSAAGTYVYRYTVTSGSLTDSADVTVVWSGLGDVRINDNCQGSRVIGVTASPFNVSLSDNNDGPCASGLRYPLPSGRALPSSWGTGISYVGDTWYRVLFPSCESSYTVTVTVESTLATGSAKGLAVEVYFSCDPNGCEGTFVSTSSAGSLSQGSVSVDMLVKAANSRHAFIRVASQLAGSFVVRIASDSVCVGTTAELCANEDTLFNVLGYSGSNVLGCGVGEVLIA